MSRAAFHDAARDQLVCAVTGRGGAFHAHHAVREQDVRGADAHDPRNALRLSVPVHARHHTKFERVPLSALTDENIAYAYELFGEYAPDYLRRHYGGSDPRLEATGA